MTDQPRSSPADREALAELIFTFAGFDIHAAAEHADKILAAGWVRSSGAPAGEPVAWALEYEDMDRGGPNYIDLSKCGPLDDDPIYDLTKASLSAESLEHIREQWRIGAIHKNDGDRYRLIRVSPLGYLSSRSSPTPAWNEAEILAAKNRFASSLDRVELNTTHPGQRAILIGDAVDRLVDAVRGAARSSGEDTARPALLALLEAVEDWHSVDEKDDIEGVGLALAMIARMNNARKAIGARRYHGVQP